MGEEGDEVKRKKRTLLVSKVFQVTATRLLIIINL